jgi:C-terminal processing protease CtpA/Prc
LINNGTLSQGEIFTLQLKELRNVTVLGQSSKGVLAYGSNYGIRKRLPSQSFEVYITDIWGTGGKKLLPYESRGVAPDITLSPGRDWIAQTTEIIKQKP